MKQARKKPLDKEAVQKAFSDYLHLKVILEQAEANQKNKKTYALTELKKKSAEAKRIVVAAIHSHPSEVKALLSTTEISLEPLKNLIDQPDDEIGQGYRIAELAGITALTLLTSALSLAGAAFFTWVFVLWITQLGALGIHAGGDPVTGFIFGWPLLLTAGCLYLGYQAINQLFVSGVRDFAYWKSRQKLKSTLELSDDPVSKAQFEASFSSAFGELINCFDQRKEREQRKMLQELRPTLETKHHPKPSLTPQASNATTSDPETSNTAPEDDATSRRLSSLDQISSVLTT